MLSGREGEYVSSPSITFTKQEMQFSEQSLWMQHVPPEKSFRPINRLFPFPSFGLSFFFFLLFSPVSLDGCNSGVQVIWRGEPYVWKYGVHQVWLWAWVGFLFLTPIPIATTGWSKCYYSFFCFLELISFHHKSLQFYCSISRGLAT